MAIKCGGILSKCRKCEEQNVGRATQCGTCGEDLHCDKYAVPGYTRCVSHGGPVPARNFYGRGTMTTGAGSSFPIMRLAAKYNEMRKNGQLLSNRHAVEIIDDRIAQLAERIDVNDAPDRMQTLGRLWAEYKQALAARDDQNAMVIRIALDDQFEKAYHDYAAWNQIFSAFDLRRKMVESEVKILKEIRGIISVEDAYELSAKMLAAMVRVVGDDPKKLKQVQYEFARIIGESSDLVTEGYVSEDRGDGGSTDSEP